MLPQHFLWLVFFFSPFSILLKDWVNNLSQYLYQPYLIDASKLMILFIMEMVLYIYKTWMGRNGTGTRGGDHIWSGSEHGAGKLGATLSIMGQVMGMTLPLPII